MGGNNAGASDERIEHSEVLCAGGNADEPIPLLAETFASGSGNRVTAAKSRYGYTSTGRVDAIDIGRRLEYAKQEQRNRGKYRNREM
jgi:hypothetical protein